MSDGRGQRSTHAPHHHHHHQQHQHQQHQQQHRGAAGYSPLTPSDRGTRLRDDYNSNYSGSGGGGVTAHSRAHHAGASPGIASSSHSPATPKGAGGGGGAASTPEAGPSKAALRCSFPSCGKTFTRKDHLIRHAANHSQPNFHCSTCGRSFQRLDLLQRHERRRICDDERYPKRRKGNEHDDRQAEHDDDEVDHGASEAFEKPPPPPQPPQPQAVFQPAPPPGAPLDLLDTTEPVSIPPQMGSDMPELDVMANHNIVIDPADLGFGLWPPDPWEALLHDAFAPPLDEGPADVPWDLNALLGPHGTQSRTQESAERGNAPGPPHAQVGTALLSRVLAAYPELQISVAELNESLSTYWSHVAPSFPFIHRGTFDIDAAPPELVIMMAVTGAAQRRRGGGGGAPRDDRRLVRRIRARLVEDRCGLEMDVATLQAYTLCHVYDVWHGDAETLFVAQCMWPVVVAHSRKQGIGVTGRVAPEGHTAAVWAAWAKDEERRRAAYCIVTIDTQISTFWNQHPSRQLSIFAHNLSMPAPRAQWEALTAAEWLRVREPSSTTQHDHNAGRRGGRGGYLPGLHPEFQVSFVTEGYSSIVLAALAAEGPPPLRVDIDNSFAVGVILTGLVAIAWDCRTRGGMGIRFRDGTKHWRSIVLNAVVALRAAYELGVGHLPACVETRDMRDTLAVSIISILSDIPMLQVAAGATSICGASIGPKQYADGKRRLRLWATSPDAWTCLWQSARYLRETLFADWGLYTPWAVFLTTLVVWAYGSAASREDQRHFPGPTDNPQAAATALLDGIFASPTRVDHLDHGVADLVVTVAAKLDATGSLIDRTNAQLLWRLTAAKRR